MAVVYAYGCGQPISGIDHLRVEHAKQRSMWDALVTAERTADRSQWDAARSDPDIDALVEQIDAVSSTIAEAVKSRRAERAKYRRKVDTPELDAKISEQAEMRRELRKTLWPMLAEWRKGNKDRIKAIETARRAASKKIRQCSGLYWGNYNRVSDDFEQGRRLAKKRGGFVRYSDPVHSDGVLTVQIQRTASGLGASFQELCSGAFSGLIIAPVNEHAFVPIITRGERKRLCRTTISMRVDAAGNRIELPLFLHRLPPAGSRIKSAQLTWRQEGERKRWQLALTCSYPSVEITHDGESACGIDIGWRKEADGSLLVATIANTSGDIDRLTVPAKWMTAMDQVERLQSYIDDDTIELARGRHNSVADLPDDLRAPLMGWRPKLGASHVDVSALHDAVRARIAAAQKGAPADVPADIRYWYDRYRHLSVWRDNKRAKLMRQRREHYRLYAKDICEKYALVAIEDFDLSEVARTKKRAPEDGENELHAAARAQRQRAALYEFRKELENQARKTGTEIVRVKKDKTTTTCHGKGHITGQIDRSRMVWTCEICGDVWDRDENAARNILDAAVGSARAPVKNAA